MIPSFLRREKRKTVDELGIRFGEAIGRYHKHFPDDVLITEPSVLSREEWINAIDECIAQNKTIWELFGEKYNSRELY